MAPKKPKKSAKPKAPKAAAPLEEETPVTPELPEDAIEEDEVPAAELEDLHIPEEHLPTGVAAPEVVPTPSERPDPKTVDPVDFGDFVETLHGYGEAEYDPDARLPDMYELLGQKVDARVQEGEESSYKTEMVMAAGQVNLIWHPVIVCGRCEMCGATRYVGGEVWRRINKKTGEVTYKYRHGKWVAIDAAHCKHYRHIQIRCSYCGEEFTGEKDRLGQFSQVLGSRNVFVVSQPGAPKVLIMRCSDFACVNKFNEQFHINNHL